MTDMTPKLFAAMAAAFPRIEGALRDSNNPHFKSKYADLSSVVEAIKPALTANELFFVQCNHEQNGGVCVETLVCHSSGEQMSFGKLFVPAGKQDAQGYGSALTYARRYSLMTAFGVCPEDDDGNAAARTPRNEEPAETLSEDQFRELADLVERTNTDLVPLCQYYGVDALKHLPADRFEHCRGTLTKKLPSQKKAA